MSFMTNASDFVADYFFWIGLVVLALFYIAGKVKHNMAKKKREKMEKVKRELDEQEIELKKMGVHVDEYISRPDPAPAPQYDARPKVEPPTKPPAYSPPPPRPEPEMPSFDSHWDDSSERDTVKKVMDSVQSMENKNIALTGGMIEDLDRLKSTLAQIRKEKETVKAYGNDLVKLYKSYELREKELSSLVQGMDKALQRLGQDSP